MSSSRNLLPITAPVALVTGGGTGLGKAQALEFAKAGMTVIVVGRREGPLKAVQDEINSLTRGSNNCHVMANIDIGKTESWERLVSMIENEFDGQLHLLSNCAGHEGAWSIEGAYDRLDPKDMIRYNNTYITSTQLSYHYMVPLLSKGSKVRDGKPSVVINFSSLAGVCPKVYANLLPQYHPCKVAIEAMTRCSHLMFQEKGVLSYGINPAFYESDMVTSIASPMNFDSGMGLVDAFNPVSHMGRPKHVGDIALAMFQSEGKGDMEPGMHYVMTPISENESLLANPTTFRTNMDSMNPLIIFESFLSLNEAYGTDGQKVSNATLEQFKDDVRKKMRMVASAAGQNNVEDYDKAVATDNKNDETNNDDNSIRRKRREANTTNLSGSVTASFVAKEVDAESGTDRTFKLAYGLYCFVAYCLVSFNVTKFTFNSLIGLGLILVAVPWFLLWLHMLCCSPSLYRVMVPTARIEGWTTFSVPTSVELYKNMVAPSISSLSGIRGTQLHMLLYISTCVIAVLFLMAMQHDLNYRQASLAFNLSSNEDMVPFCFFLGIIGVFNIGHFEYTDYDLIHTVLHYIAAGPIVLSSLGLGYITNWSEFSIVLTIIMTILVVSYFTVSSILPKYHKDPKTVTLYSKICIGIELAGFFVIGIMALLTINGCGPNEGNIWASPFAANHENDGGRICAMMA